MSEFEEECEALLVALVGEEPLVQLGQAMLDAGVPAIDLAAETEGWLARLRDDVLELLRREIGLLSGVASPIPWYFEDVEPNLTVLLAGMKRFYLHLPESAFNVFNPDSRVITALSHLANDLDDQGLLDFGSLKADGYGIVDGNALHYHQFLRRGFLGSMNDGLMNLLLNVGRRDGNRLRVAIDDRRLTTEREMRRTIEEDFWFGPPLTEEFLDDPYSDGRTVHRYPDGDARCELGYEAIFAYWRMNGEVERVVQMEELTVPGSGTVGSLHPLRYFHSIRNIETHDFIHCDGAVRGYEPPSFVLRRLETMPPSTPAERYRKVFRVDGSISTSEWSNIVTKWFRSNRLVEEYLSTLS